MINTVAFKKEGEPVGERQGTRIITIARICTAEDKECGLSGLSGFELRYKRNADCQDCQDLNGFFA
jgi:hypothetical protein